ncbi:MAG TPA: hypothetical protein VFP12_03405 [Allosphingosinicella sp.]|nr:hypothetical protein [Allosphingosinicella sp.]
MLRLLLLFPLAFALSGCAGSLGYVLDPAIDSDHLDEPDEPNKLKAMKGDRRLIRTHRSSRPDLGIRPDDYEVCAETHADAIGARSGASSIAITGKGEVSESLTEELVKTVERSTVSDVVRHLHWHTCNARLNRWIDEGQYYQEVRAIRTGAFEALIDPKKVEKATPPGQAVQQVTTGTGPSTASGPAKPKDPKGEQ